MANAQITARWGIASLVGGAAVVAFVAFGFGLVPSTNISGQISGTTPAPVQNVTISYDGAYINQVVPGKRTDEIKDVTAFPDQPAMIVRTEEALTLWVREGTKLRSLLEIPLDSGPNRVEFLQDGSTFVVISKQRARVFALNRTVTPQETRRR
jgi:hypothetical protein